MHLLRQFCRYFVGVLFLISGFVKLVDPTGTAIKLEEYFVVFADRFTSLFNYLKPFAMFFSFSLTILEMVLGVALIFLYRIKITLRLLVAIIGFFTLLTFYSAFTGEVTDCGCFGDAMPLTPWQSFTKDIVLSVMIIFLLFQQKHFKPVFQKMTGHLVVALTLTASFIFALYNINHEPVIDFRPYKVGNNIHKLRIDGEAGIFHYKMEKNGKTEILEAWPTDPEYKFVEMIKIKEPKLPTIKDFNLSDVNGDQGTEEILVGKKLLIISKKIEEFDPKLIAPFKTLADQAKQKGIDVVVLCGSGFDRYNEFNKQAKFDYPVYTIDETVIKAMLRSNPGIMLLNDGVVTGKWHFNDIPTIEKVNELLNK